MTNRNENNDSERQFLADLEKATALSLETLALEEFKKKKILTHVSSPGTTQADYSRKTLQDYQKYLSQKTRPMSYDFSNETDIRISATSANRGPVTSSAPARRFSEVDKPAVQAVDVPDLISLNANNIVVKNPKEDAHSSFKELINQMHQVNAQIHDPLQQQKSMRSNSLTTIPFGYPVVSPASQTQQQQQPFINNTATMQLVPYINQTPAAPKPLTPDELNRLYNLNKQPAQIAHPSYPGMAYPFQSYTPPFVPDVRQVQQMNQQVLNLSQQSSTTTFPQMQLSASQTSIGSYNPSQYSASSQLNSGYGSVQSINNQPFARPQSQPQATLPYQQQINNSVDMALVPKLPPRQLTNSPIQLPREAVVLHPSTSSNSLNTPPVVLRKKTGDDLIDLNQGSDDNSRVSVLEAFDPLICRSSSSGDDYDDDKGDNESTYYSEYDPFDYIYSGGTQYSDPVYDAINRTEKMANTSSALSPPNSASSHSAMYATSSATIGWNINMNSPLSFDERTPPPLPPRNSDSHYYSGATDSLSGSVPLSNTDNTMILDRRKRLKTKLYENVQTKKKYDKELIAFYNMVKELRNQYKHDDTKSNIGHVVAAEFDNQYSEGTSIKLLVYPSVQCLPRQFVNDYYLESQLNDIGGNDCGAGNVGVLDVNAKNNLNSQFEGYGKPVAFTCDIGTTVEHVVMHVFCELEGQIIGNVDDFILKSIGTQEWLSSSSKLNQLECVHNSIKLERDVLLGLCRKTPDIMTVIARTPQDDMRDVDIKLEDILPKEPVSSISYDDLMILLETLETEIDKLESAASDSNSRLILSCSGVTQAVKAICALLGSIDTIDINISLAALKYACTNVQSQSYKDTNGSLSIVSESGDYAEVRLGPKSMSDQISQTCNRVRNAIQNLLEIYTNAFRVNFCVSSDDFETAPVSILEVSQPLMIRIQCVHRPPLNWRHDDYLLGAQIYHGTRYLGEPVIIQCSNDLTGGIYPRLKFDSLIMFEDIPLCTLPREARLIFVLYGCSTEPVDGNDNSTSNQNQTTSDMNPSSNGRVTRIELGWSSIQFFDYERKMIQGSHLLSLWPPTPDKYFGPSPAKGTHPHGDTYPVLGVEIKKYGDNIVYPEAIRNLPSAPCLDFNSLDANLKQELIDTAEQGYPLDKLDKREVLWEKRYYLHKLPHALPKVLHAAHSWDFACLADLHALMYSWRPLQPLQAIELLLPRYPDIEVRKQAVEWISKMPTDQLVIYLPQLLQALKHDNYDASSLSRLLLKKSMESPRLAHHLYWLLVHSLPGEAPQNSSEFTHNTDVTLVIQARYHRRNQLMLRALLAICGANLASRFLSQNMMCKALADVAHQVKMAKESLRMQTLKQGMDNVHKILEANPTTLPLGPGLEVTGINTRSCSYFNSNTLPLKINFIGPDKELLPAIFKCGDDLQQDMLTIQMVRIMDKLWLAEGLDLKMVTFECVPTGYKKGMIELVSDAETLRKIQVEWGLTGSFKDKPISEWLAKQNPSQLEYQRAVDNFTVSCAGYSVVTYILGICDRHNDNIMLKTSGHLFHIDFGKFLGDAQMFGNFKRDRTPFVLTSDMAYVINGGDKPSSKFHRFVDLCCQAFNIVRKHGDLILHMFALMTTSGIPGVTGEAVNYVRNALLPGQSNPEASASFAKMIHISLKSWFTQFNFFLHNLAQLRFSGETGDGELLSFVPRTYTMAQDGRLKTVIVHGYQKRYELEKYYIYILKVTRQNQPDPAYLFRTYKEFSEFHQKLCLHYPLVKLHSLPSGIHVGRSNIKTVADRRMPEIRLFLKSLFNAADEIAHSNLVYTFFHPILRDQQESDIHVAKVKDVRAITDPTERVCGEIKLSLQYHRGALTVMVHHARSLPATPNGQEPNTYVKVYLTPDKMKLTKRKTKVVRKTCFPSFMETLEYRMPLDAIQCRLLQATVWSHDSLQENEFLGGVELNLAKIDLKVELINWYRLGYLPRT